MWTEFARVRDVCFGRTSSGGGGFSSLNHAGRIVACGPSGLSNRASGWPESRVRVTLDRVRSTLGSQGRPQRRRHAPSPGCAVPRRPSLGQMGSIRGTGQDLGTSECVFFHLQCCLLLLWALLVSARVEAKTGQAAGSQ